VGRLITSDKSPRRIISVSFQENSMEQLVKSIFNNIGADILQFKRVIYNNNNNNKGQIAAYSLIVISHLQILGKAICVCIQKRDANQFHPAVSRA